MYYIIKLGEFYFTGTYNHFLEPQEDVHLHKAKFYQEKDVADKVAAVLRKVIRDKSNESHYGKVKIVTVTLEE